MYQHHCKTITELSKFYAQHGISIIQLKGVGFSTYYTNPIAREGGDIDIYTFSADKSMMSDKETIELADQLL